MKNLIFSLLPLFSLLFFVSCEPDYADTSSSDNDGRTIPTYVTVGYAVVPLDSTGVANFDSVYTDGLQPMFASVNESASTEDVIVIDDNDQILPITPKSTELRPRPVCVTNAAEDTFYVVPTGMEIQEFLCAKVRGSYMIAPVVQDISGPFYVDLTQARDYPTLSQGSPKTSGKAAGTGCASTVIDPNGKGMVCSYDPYAIGSFDCNFYQFLRNGRKVSEDYNDPTKFYFIKDAKSMSSSAFTQKKDRKSLQSDGYYIAGDFSASNQIKPYVSGFYNYVGIKVTDKLEEAVNISFFDNTTGLKESSWTQCSYIRKADMSRGMSFAPSCYMYKRKATECYGVQVLGLPKAETDHVQFMNPGGGVTSTQALDGASCHVNQLFVSWSQNNPVNYIKDHNLMSYYKDGNALRYVSTNLVILTIREVMGGLTNSAGYYFKQGIFVQVAPTATLEDYYYAYNSKFNK